MEQKIIDFIQNIAFENGLEGGVTRDTDLFANNILDSMGIITLLSYIEEEFNIEFSVEDLQFDCFQTIDAILKWIGKKT